MFTKYIEPIFKKAVFELGTDESTEISFDIPKIAEHGDLSTNIAMKLAKDLKKNPKLIDVLHVKLTFFEIYTALALLYFKEKHVDFAVLETGLGGRLDATNAVNALVSVITPISLEHTQFLGKTLAKIHI